MSTVVGEGGNTETGQAKSAQPAHIEDQDNETHRYDFDLQPADVSQGTIRSVSGADHSGMDESEHGTIHCNKDS